MTSPALRVIGTIRSDCTSLDDTPVQASLNPDAEGVVELDPWYVDALDGLQEFSHLWLLTWLAPPDRHVPVPNLRQVPFLLRRQPRLLGIFATRGPRRPNPIGLSLVRIVAVDGATIRFAGVDMLDGTSVVDLKPYVPRFDHPHEEVRAGWFDTVRFDDRITPAELGLPGDLGEESHGSQNTT